LHVSPLGDALGQPAHHARLADTRHAHQTGIVTFALGQHVERLLDDVVAITTYGTGLTALVRSDGSSVVNSIPGPVQYAFTIEASAAAGGRLYLLVQGHDGRAQVWALGPLET